jgi:hypothetical protein
MSVADPMDSRLFLPPWKAILSGIWKNSENRRSCVSLPGVVYQREKEDKSQLWLHNLLEDATAITALRLVQRIMWRPTMK